MVGTSKEIRSRLRNLENHLYNESPLLVDAVKGFKELDRVAYRLGLLDKTQSYATQIPWWPLISVLGTNSIGKADFLKTYLNSSFNEFSSQKDGEQDIEEKFTVLCYANGDESRLLPGIALDADPRFPFYQMSDELEKLAPGHAQTVNGCLQLKTCPSKQLQGYIYIDAPGFDTEPQCASTLRITDHIIDFSDLVLVFVDVKQLETDNVHDRLKYLLSNSVTDKYANKLIYVLNDNSALDNKAADKEEENNTAWRSVSSEENLGSAKVLVLSSNKLDKEKSDDTTKKQSLSSKYYGDSDEINDRIQQIYIDRTYRILGNLDNLTRDIEQHTIPKLRTLVRQWESKVLWRDVISFSMLSTFGFVAAWLGGVFDNLKGKTSWLESWIISINDNIWNSISVGAALFAILFLIHNLMRISALRSVLSNLEDDYHEKNKESLKKALIKNTRFMRSIFRPEIVGLNRSTRNRIKNILKNADEAIQRLNDKYARPSGKVE